MAPKPYPIGGKGTYLYGSTPLREYWSGPGSTSFQSTLLVRDPAGKKWKVCVLPFRHDTTWCLHDPISGYWASNRCSRTSHVLLADGDKKNHRFCHNFQTITFTMNGVKKEKNDRKTFKMSAYLLALRPWSFSASCIPVVLGAVLCWKTTGHFNLILLVLSMIAVFSHHDGTVSSAYRRIDRKIHKVYIHFCTSHRVF